MKKQEINKKKINKQGRRKANINIYKGNNSYRHILGREAKKIKTETTYTSQREKAHGDAGVKIWE